jgi:putative phosphoribosyl transferase
VSQAPSFRDRADAGRQLAARLDHLEGERPVVLALPRGGVPVAAPIAARLHAPLDLLMVRKVGVPGHPELAMGAIGEAGTRVLEQRVLREVGVTPAQLADAEAQARAELERRAVRYRGAGCALVPVDGRPVVIVDDGIATGSTARAAIRIARARGTARVVLAVPVAAADTVRALHAEVDELVVVDTPEDFGAVGQFYRDFAQVSDDDVIAALTAPP